MSYQPEERYWTDYLRIALPVVGLLLMLGLFWFWAASLIGDEDDDDPNDLAAVATATVPAPSPSPSPPPGTEAAGEEGENATDSDTPPAADGAEAANGNAENATDEENPDAANDETSGDETTGDDGNGGESPACDTGDFCEGVIATVNSDNVRLREEPSTEGGEETVIDVLSNGDQVEVVGDPIDGDDGNEWVEVETDLGDGFVATEFLDPES